MLIAALCLVLGTVSAAVADPPPPAVSPLTALSPSIEADADYLLTTTDFMQAQFGMSVESVQATPDRLLIRTTGAQFAFEPKAGLLRISQRLGKPREAAVVTFARGALSGLAVARQGTGAVLLTADRGRLKLRINADSLMMLKAERPLAVAYRLGFLPASLRQSSANFLAVDEYGFVGSYLAAGKGEQRFTRDDLAITHELAPEQVLWLCVGPPRPYDWQASLRDRVIWHWSNQTGYPTDAEIAEWSKYGNQLLQQSEVMLWEDWSLRFIPRNGLAEFQRVNDTCRKYGMRNYVYTSPFYFLTGTGQESKAMNSFEHFAETGFSPGDDRGLNWPIFLAEITKVMREYKPQGLYFDGIYGNVLRTYLISRKAREVVGDKGLLEYHATWSPPGGGGVFLPQIDTYFNYVLRGEGAQEMYASDDYLRYFVSTYNISNSIGVLCDNGDYKLDAPFMSKLLDDNIRVHLIPSWLTDYRKDVMAKDYWPALKPGLRARVDRMCAQRQTAVQHNWDAIRAAEKAGTEGQKLAFSEDFQDAGFRATAPEAPADHAPQITPPASPAFIPLPNDWQAYFSANSTGAFATADGVLRIGAIENSCAYIERPLPENVATVQCKIRCSGAAGMSWGPGLMLLTPGGRYRINVREEGRIGVDRAAGQMLIEGYPAGEWYWLRIRLIGGFVFAEASHDGAKWLRLASENAVLAGPMRLLIGKIADAGTNVEYPGLGGPGVSEIAEVKVFTR